VLLKIVA